MICVDASVAVKWVLQEELSDQARALYRAHLRMREPIVAPSLLLYEVTNTVRHLLRKSSGMSLVAARRALADLLAASIEFHSPPGLHQAALMIADDHDLPTAYDAHYVALSDMLGCEFWTADGRLLRHVQKAMPFVRWLGDYAPNDEQ
jgi:predicted nucleic acid-binding protein